MATFRRSRFLFPAAKGRCICTVPMSLHGYREGQPTFYTLAPIQFGKTGTQFVAACRSPFPGLPIERAIPLLRHTDSFARGPGKCSPSTRLATTLSSACLLRATRPLENGGLLTSELFAARRLEPS